MKDTSTIRAGLFLIIALGLFVIGSLWVAGLHPGGTERVSYEVLMQSSGGVRQGDPVRVAGMEVGRVQGVDLRPGVEWPVLFRIGLDASILVTEAASARLTTDGLLGSPYLEIDPGPVGASPLPADTPIRGLEVVSTADAMSGIGQLSDRAGVALDEVTVLLQSLSARTGPLLERFEMLMSDQNLASISESLTAMRDTMQEAGPRLTSLMTRLDELAIQLETGVAGIPDLTADLQGLVGDLRTALGPDGERLSSLLDSAGDSMSSMQMNKGELDAMVRDLRLATANLKAFTESIKERPSALVRGNKGPDRKPGEGVDR
jgi:phospholipid/cholesterol/gamma-HCH transport system substrate-binding protein